MSTPNTTTTSMIEYLGHGSPDGIVVGKTSESLVGFYGATPVALQTSPTAPATTAATSTSPWGFSGSTQANAVINAVVDIIAVLKNLGLVT